MSVEIARSNFGGRLYIHPADPLHVLRIYRKFLVEHKRKLGGIRHRGLIHYRAILLEYLAAKRRVLGALK